MAAAELRRNRNARTTRPGGPRWVVMGMAGCARPGMLQRERQSASMSLGDAVMHYRAAYHWRSVRTERYGRNDPQKFLLVPSRPAPGMP